MTNPDLNKQQTSAMEKVILATSDLNNSRKNTLDDEQRVKILSPGMLVLKRFLRNKLAIVGLVILICMFLFSFVGPIFSPYSQTQFFVREEKVFKPYASAKYNIDMRSVTADGKKIANDVNVKFLLAKGQGKDSFTVNKSVYTIQKLSESSYALSTMQELGQIFAKGVLLKFPNDPLFTPEFQTLIKNAIDNNLPTVDYKGETYSVQKDKMNISIGAEKTYALFTKNVFYPYAPEYESLVNNLDFDALVEKTIADNQSGFEHDGVKYTVDKKADNIVAILKEGQEIALMTDIIVTPKNKSQALPLDFTLKTIDAVINREKSFEFEVNGKNDLFKITLSNGVFDIRNEQLTTLHDTFAAPSKAHWAGTDEKAFDVFTRLMYGGRISLLVGFVVVFLEIFIGVIFGGISGYFGGFVDLCLMRFIDLFNSIPSLPLMIILGSVMDTLEVPSYQRIFLLMFLLGFLGWTGIARVVRGQILTLREQDFMIATEATGLSVSKRIFRHLVPNVMPLLIVQATLGLGGIIITEATLSFLGLGVKPPLASWGSIINAANDLHVMKNNWWIWIPTGSLIVLTVLGFNFVGDGLRDAYDPKMKR